MDIFIGTTLQWFSEILDDHITYFPQFSIMFKEQFSDNKVDPQRLPNLFEFNQREGKLLKEYINRFYAVWLQTSNEEVMVTAFIKGITTSPLSDSLIRNRAE